eukprot:Lithocolla_globosa_v1_NODE_2270_length_2080_cov_6.656790.p1 type:complete len:412 gc:universal NODE_2270_length_2080_cov_6.656790:681-1916(+)
MTNISTEFYRGWTVAGYYPGLLTLGQQGPRGAAGRAILSIDQHANGSLYFNFNNAPMQEGPFISQFVDDQLRVFGTNHANKLTIEDNALNVIFNVDTITPQVNISSDCIISGALTLESNAIVRSLIPFGAGFDLGSMSKKYAKLYTTNITDNGTKTIINNATVTGSLIGSSTSFTGNLAGEVRGTQGATVVNNIGTKSSHQIQLAVDLCENVSEFNDFDTVILRDDANGSATSFTGNLVGDVTGTQTNTIVSTVGGKTTAQIAASVDATLAGTVTLTGDVTGSSNSNVVEFVGSKSSVEISDSVDLTDGATSSYNLNNLVLRDAFGGAEFNQLLTSSSGLTIDNVAETHSLTVTDSPFDQFVISYDTNPVLFINDGSIDCDSLRPSIADSSTLGAYNQRWGELYTTKFSRR